MIKNFDSFSVNTKQKKNDLLLFFLLAYVIAWISFFCELLIQSYNIELLVMDDFNLILFLFQTITKFGPTIAGIIIALWLGKPVLKDLLSRQVDVSKPLKYYLSALLFPPIIMLIAIGITMMLDSSVILSIVIPNVFLGLIYWLGLRFFFGGGLGEELGFRGFALTRLLTKMEALKASFYLGILWTFWHLPGWILTYDSANGIIVRSFGQVLVNLIVQLLFTVSLSFLFTLLFIKTDGNILIVSILHGALNGFSAFFENELFNLLDNDLWVLLYIIAFVIIGVMSAFFLRKIDSINEYVAKDQ